MMPEIKPMFQTGKVSYSKLAIPYSEALAILSAGIESSSQPRT